MNKSELVIWLQKEYQHWKGLLDQIDPQLLDQPGVAGHWSIKDIVAHMVGWEHRNIARIQAAQRGEPEPASPWPAELQNDDDVNAWIYEAYRGRSAREVLDDAHQVVQQLLAVVQGLPDDIRIETVQHGGREYYPMWFGEQRLSAGEFFDHFRDDHEADIRAWLERNN